jgi:DNA-binding MarR family transcriptional regulator
VESRSRWQALRDLLESRRLSIGGAHSGRAHNLLHAKPILQYLEGGEATQTELRETLKLSAARLSQVLAVMEEGGLIRRKKQGKGNLITLPESASPCAMSAGRMVWAQAS